MVINDLCTKLKNRDFVADSKHIVMTSIYAKNNLLVQGVLKLSHCENTDINDDDSNDTHPGLNYSPRRFAAPSRTKKKSKTK